MSERIPSTAFADAWIQVDQTEDPLFFINLLDATRAELLSRAERSPSEFFKPIDPRPGHRVLDIGCGTGDFLRLLARMVAPGAAVGVDLSETMVAEARHRTGADLANLSFQSGDVHALSFENGSFDRVLATQVLLHVTDPGRALAELSRVLAPDGRMMISELDWGTIAVESTDRELGRRFTRMACDELRNGLILRELPWRLRSLGFDNIRLIPEVQVSLGIDAFHRWFLEPSMSHFTRIGAFTAAESEAFLGDLAERSRLGTYFTSRTSYSVIASRSA
ncbi:MAG: methyltransferase domain-containing protein [Gemmatimonadota bacterium]